MLTSSALSALGSVKYLYWERTMGEHQENRAKTILTLASVFSHVPKRGYGCMASRITSSRFKKANPKKKASRKAKKMARKRNRK
jgi:hypothetical protein